MKARWNARSPVSIAVAAALVIAALGLAVWMRSPGFGLPFADAFPTRGTEGWTAYGGNWTVVGDTVRNDSDDRGAKLMTGSSHWTSYAMDADIEVLGGGDAGIVIRVKHVEEGVDSYDGYYAGLRTNDNALILGRAQDGWYEFPAAQMPEGVVPNRWYHLRLAAQGCVLTATAREIGNAANAARIETRDPQCFPAGQAGLRSMGAGGVWRNIRIARLPESAAASNTGITAEHMALYPTSQGNVPAAAASPLPETPRTPEKPVLSIRSLRLLSTTKPAHVVVRGTVILTIPSLYIQDSSGGVRVEATHPAPLRVGDEVQVEGDAYPQGLSATIRNATEEMMGGLAPIPPLSMAADQAASGAYDSMFVEVEGRLLNQAKHGALTFRDGAQTFRALTDSDVTQAAFRRLKTGSIVRLRGVCMVRPEYTDNTVPFVLIVDRPEDVKVLLGPPWWSLQHLILLALAMLGVGFLGHLFYSRAEEWRLRAVIGERERLAHEMHDTLSQSFAGIGFQIRAIRNRLQRGSGAQLDPHALLEELNVTAELVRHSHDEARRSIASLRPETLEANGLVAALEQSARRTVARGSVAVKASCAGEPRPLPLGVLDALFRIGQEAIANAIRHAHPRQILIHMDYERTAVTLTLEDDGAGFVHKPEEGGFGLAGMHRRAEGIGATLEIDSAPGSGTRIRVHVAVPDVPLLRRLAYSKRKRGINGHAY